MKDFDGGSAEPPPVLVPDLPAPFPPPIGAPESSVVPPAPVVAAEPLAPPAPAVPAVPPDPFVTVLLTHCPSSQTWFAGQWTAAHGSFTHATYNKSQ
jgi:hypothetical protein